MLQGITSASPPTFLMPAATASQASALRLETTTLAPSEAMISAAARPMPLLEPVMTATCPERSKGLFMAPAVSFSWRVNMLPRAGSAPTVARSECGKRVLNNKAVGHGSGAPLGKVLSAGGALGQPPGDFDPTGAAGRGSAALRRPDRDRISRPLHQLCRARPDQRRTGRRANRPWGQERRQRRALFA